MRDALRHAVATLAYRGGKALRDAPTGFGVYKAGPTSRTASEILAHLGDLLDWALALAKGAEVWHPTPTGAWDDDVARFFDGLLAFDAYLASPAPLACTPERLFQGPIADALTHVGQITMLRRLAGAAIRGENYFRAEIVAGRVGMEQAPPKREFD